MSIKKTREANAYFVKVDTKGPMTISMLFGELMKSSLTPGPRRVLRNGGYSPFQPLE